MSTEITTKLICDGCQELISDKPGLQLQKDGTALDFHDSTCLKAYGDTFTTEHELRVAAAEASVEVRLDG